MKKGAFLAVALVWFFYLAGLGVFFPFFSLYLKVEGLTGTQVGLVLAVAPMVGMVGQPLWGHLADRTGRRVGILLLLALGTAAGYAAFVLPRSFAGYAAVTGLHALFATSMLPALWSVTFAVLQGRGMGALGLARVAGTIGYGISVALFPSVLSWLSTSPLSSRLVAPSLRVMFPFAALCVLVAAALCVLLPTGGVVSIRARRGDLRRLLSGGAFGRLLLVVFGAFCCMQGPMALFPLLVTARGGGVAAISEMWLVMLSLEIPLVAFFGWTVSRLGVRGVMVVGIASAAIRWLVSGFVADLRVVTLVQALHGFAVWGILLGGPAYVDAVVPARLRSTAQALLATVGFGLGTVFSSVLSGLLLEHVGPSAPARWAGAGSLVLAVVALVVLPRPDAAASSPPSGRNDAG